MDTQTSSPRGDRINVCSTRHDAYMQLTQGESAPFKTMKDLFLMAATIGFQKKLKIPLEKKQGVFAWSQFSPQEDVPYIHAIILSLGEPVETLLDQGKMLDILEQYANGGIDDLSSLLLASPRPSLALANRILTESAGEGKPSEQTTA